MKAGTGIDSQDRWPSLVRFGESLARHSTLRIGGPADVFAEPVSDAQVQCLVAAAKDARVPHIFIGGGSNLLFDDLGYRGLVIKLGERFASCRVDGDKIFAQAGVWVPKVARISQQAGLPGLEHIVGIPGTIGGLVAINGGSMRQGVGSNVEHVNCLSDEAELVSMSRDDCEFSYRNSAIRKNGYIVLSVQMRMHGYDEPVAIRRRMLRILRDRRRKFPLKRANCGSVFLSSPENFESVGPPGKIIETCGLKGLRVGNAQVSSEHANFFVNLGGATSSDFRQLIDTVYREVSQQLGLCMRCEVQYVSESGTIGAYNPMVGAQ